MAKKVKTSFLLKIPSGALTPPTCIWDFTVPGNPGLAVPFSPAVPAHIFTFIATKLKDIERCHVQPIESKLNFLFNGLAHFLNVLQYVRVFLS